MSVLLDDPEIAELLLKLCAAHMSELKASTDEVLSRLVNKITRLEHTVAALERKVRRK
ncbi:MAG: hypothetical protein ACE5HE_12495 [Phycisphaerae bacterium]